MGEIVFFDTEVTVESQKIMDYGATTDQGRQIHTKIGHEFLEFIKEASFLCGHNILRHDLKQLSKKYPQVLRVPAIDTLPLSPLFFPEKPYHNLVKDDKLSSDQLNNPLNDSMKARDLFYDCVTAYKHLEEWIQQVYKGLLKEQREFKGFFDYIKGSESSKTRTFRFITRADRVDDEALEALIRSHMRDSICENVNQKRLISDNPIELAYAIAIINTNDEGSITPRWVLKSYPEVETVISLLRNTPCLTGCSYCNQLLDPVRGLQEFFGYDAYREFDGIPLQEKAVEAAVHGKSLLAIFPTGGGKSITFQIPALMAGRSTRGLTVVISPLQSLMKDQVDNLEKKGIIDSVTINGLLDPIERSKAFERVEDGSAKILYISPESLRSRSMERLLLGRRIERFVIDEAIAFPLGGRILEWIICT